MPHRLSRRAQGQEGFTLIELLVVILIIGILAAVAIPTFLSQTTKASDANLETAINTAHTAEESYRVSNGGAYTTSTTQLIAVEPSLSTPVTSDNMALAYFAASGTASSTTGYQITATDSKGNTFTLKYDVASGSTTRTCGSSNAGACSASGTWGS